MIDIHYTEEPDGLKMYYDDGRKLGPCPKCNNNMWYQYREYMNFSPKCGHCGHELFRKEQGEK